MKSYVYEASQLKALAHPVRLSLVAVLQIGACHVSALQRQVNQRQPCVSQHLQVLRTAGIVGCRQEEFYIYYYLTNPVFIEEICSALEMNNLSETEIGTRSVEPTI
jgi:ArsR family transcriptional regulator, arsenate/arsenite/antimonite-responsive transcriptional repressor